MTGYIVTFLLSVLASVVAYYICKWLDGRDSGDRPDGVSCRPRKR